MYWYWYKAQLRTMCMLL